VGVRPRAKLKSVARAAAARRLRSRRAERPRGWRSRLRPPHREQRAVHPRGTRAPSADERGRYVATAPWLPSRLDSACPARRVLHVAARPARVNRAARAVVLAHARHAERPGPRGHVALQRRAGRHAPPGQPARRLRQLPGAQAVQKRPAPRFVCNRGVSGPPCTRAPPLPRCVSTWIQHLLGWSAVAQEPPRRFERVHERTRTPASHW